MREQTSLRELEEKLLRAGRSERAPAATRRNVKAAIGLAAGVGIAATAGSAAAAGAGGKTSAGLISTVVLLKCLGVGAACGVLTLSALKLTAPEPASEQRTNVAMSPSGQVRKPAPRAAVAPA